VTPPNWGRQPGPRRGVALREFLRTTIVTRNLACSACGGTSFATIGANEFRCEHCRAVTLVEDDVAWRRGRTLADMQRRQAFDAHSS